MIDISSSRRVIAISPHLDDAVLSVGGILAAAGPGCAEVWTLYTDGPGLDALPPSRRALGDYETRKREDRSALAVLGVGGRHFDLRERIWREPRPARLSELFRGASGVAVTPELVEVREVVSGALATGATVLAPLGVGHHVDHLEVAVGSLEAALDAGALHRIAFYEDFYALSERLRRLHPVTRADPTPWRMRPGTAAPVAGVLTWALARVPTNRSLDRWFRGMHFGSWGRSVAPMSDADEARKLRAVAEYSSQLALLGPAGRWLPNMIRRSHRARGGEALWFPRCDAQA